MIVDRLKDVHQETVGGKALGLLRLQAQGFRVPDFFVLPASTLAVAGSSGGSLSSEIQHDILIRLERWHWQEKGVAVRSSVAGEDGLTHAFAGMMDSFLGIQDEASLWQAIAQVVQSAWSDRALAYRKEKQIEGKIIPAVVIQRQITAELSGVLFTVNPVYPNEMAIHTVPGLGVGLVNGELEPTEIYLDRSHGEVLHEQVRTPPQCYQPTASGGIGLVENERDGKLSAALFTELYQVSRRIEKQEGVPQDMEFCMADEQLYLLQSRPITVPIARQVVYDNSNIQESYCGVTTPLTFSFARRAYATVYTQTMQVLGLPSATIAAHQEMVNNLLGLVKGRIYYHINHWYRGLQLLPSFRQNKADMEKMMGLQEPVDFVEDQTKSIFQKIKMLPRLAMTMGQLLYRFARLDRDSRAFQERFTKYFDQFYALPLADMSLNQLWKQKEWLDQTLLYHWTTPIINDFYVMMKNGAALRALQRSGVASAEETLQRYLSGDLEIDSLQPTLALMTLARQAKKNSALCQLLNAAPTDSHARVAAQFPDFLAEVQRYIHRYGDRTVGELKLETVTMRVAPAVFYQYLRNYLSTDVAFPSRNVSKPPGSASVRRKLASLKKGIQRREALRLERTRLFGMYRTLFLLMGQQFAQQGTLSSACDIFYLEESAIAHLVQSPASFDSSIITERKRQGEVWEQETVPARVVVPSRPVAPRKSVSQNYLTGEPCVPGKVRGEAIVISRPDDDLAVKDKIICALRTDPGWAALFPVCKAVLIEKGSSLSHSAILLRELGIPTIINIPHLTQAVKTGTNLALDASTGDIILEAPATV